MTVKTFTKLQKISISNKLFFNFIFIKEYWKQITISTKILSSKTVSTLIIKINVSWAVNIRLISEVSCDTEDWSTDDENQLQTLAFVVLQFWQLSDEEQEVHDGKVRQTLRRDVDLKGAIWIKRQKVVHVNRLYHIT